MPNPRNDTLASSSAGETPNFAGRSCSDLPAHVFNRTYAKEVFGNQSYAPTKGQGIGASAIRS